MVKKTTAKTSSTSLNVNPDLWREAKIKAITKKMTLTDLVEKAIKEWIDTH